MHSFFSFLFFFLLAITKRAMIVVGGERGVVKKERHDLNQK